MHVLQKSQLSARLYSTPVMHKLRFQNVVKMLYGLQKMQYIVVRPHILKHGLQFQKAAVLLMNLEKSNRVRNEV